MSKRHLLSKDLNPTSRLSPTCAFFRMNISVFGPFLTEHKLPVFFQLQGIPNDGNLQTVDDAVTICSSIIFICSVQHAAVNFPQYDMYAFAPNMPISLNGEPLKNKVASK